MHGRMHGPLGGQSEVQKGTLLLLMKGHLLAPPPLGTALECDGCLRVCVYIGVLVHGVCECVCETLINKSRIPSPGLALF